MSRVVRAASSGAGTSAMHAASPTHNAATVALAFPFVSFVTLCVLVMIRFNVLVSMLEPMRIALVVTGGVIGWDTFGHLPADFIAQVRQTLSNIAAILAEGGARPEHLVRLTWYVVDVEEYLADPKGLGRVYREVIGAHYPAMAVVQVVRLVEKAARVEIEATAVVPC